MINLLSCLIQHKKGFILNLLLTVCILFTINTNGQSNNFEPRKSINASIGFGKSVIQSSSSKSFLLTFEKDGIIGSGTILDNFDLGFERFFQSGIYFSYQKGTYDDYFEFDYSMLGIGARIGVNTMALVNEFSNQSIDIENLDVHAGIQWGYTFFDADSYLIGFGRLRPRIFLTGKYYFTDNIGVKLELGNTAFTTANIGASLRF